MKSPMTKISGLLATVFVATALSACTVSGSSEPVDKLTEEPEQAWSAGPNTGALDKNGADMGVQNVMKNWLSDNIDTKWSSKKVDEKVSVEVIDNSSESKPRASSTTLQVTYKGISESDFYDQMLRILTESGYDEGRYECSSSDSPNLNSVRTCGIAFDEAELRYNDFFAVKVVWRSDPAKNVTEMAVTLKDDPTK